MAGYDGFSKSNNAVLAEYRGLVTATALATMLKVPSRFIIDHAPSEEWHHTSKFYNETCYYDPAVVQEWLDSEGRPLLQKWRAKTAAVTVHEDCKVEWLDWPEKKGRPIEREAFGATVAVKGATATVTFADGSQMRKRVNANGFRFQPQYHAYQREMAATARKIRAAKRALRLRFRAAVRGQQLQTCDYFAWRDGAKRDSASVQWASTTRTAIEQALDESGLDYAERAVQRLEQGDRDVVRIGLHIGLRAETP